MTHSPAFRLSICIATFNRAELLGQTLDSIIAQMTDDCEIVISDNASTDSTEQVVAEYASKFNRIRYCRQETNKGVDYNFDNVVEIAHGEYCWLMSDDDLMKPGAVERVLSAICLDFSLIILNYEFKDFDMSRVLQQRALDFTSDRIYGPDEASRLFEEAGDKLWFIGNIVIKRATWMARERQKYYGSLFIHIAVMFQKPMPGETLVIANPLVSYRMGNAHTYSPQSIEIAFVKWPSLIESMALSASARSKVRSVEPWKNPRWLLVLRGWDKYSLKEYRRWVRPRLKGFRQKFPALLIAVLPGALINTLLVLHYCRREDRGRDLHWLTHCRHNLWNPYST